MLDLALQVHLYFKKTEFFIYIKKNLGCICAVWTLNGLPSPVCIHVSIYVDKDDAEAALDS